MSINAAMPRTGNTRKSPTRDEVIDGRREKHWRPGYIENPNETHAERDARRLSEDN